MGKEEIVLPFSDMLWIVLKCVRNRIGRFILALTNTSLAIAYMNFVVVASYMNPNVEVSLLYWLLGVSLGVAAMSMLASVYVAFLERIKEVGVWKSLGALNKHIFEMFILEGVLLGVVGGVLGLMLGLLINVLLSLHSLEKLWEVLTSPGILPGMALAPSLAVLSLGVALALSLVSSIYPSYKASKMNPADALRFEV